MTQVILPKDVDSKFRFITVAAQRAKQLQAGAKPRVETRSRKPTRIAAPPVERPTSTTSANSINDGPSSRVRFSCCTMR